MLNLWSVNPARLTWFLSSFLTCSEPKLDFFFRFNSICFIENIHVLKIFFYFNLAKTTKIMMLDRFIHLLQKNKRGKHVGIFKANTGGGEKKDYFYI